jgi:ABC-type phosphate/phosphonate transport system substrate-binding protein
VFGAIGMKTITILCLVLLSLSSQYASADYIFAAPPREGEMRGIKLYGPLVKKLAEVLGENVIYEQPSNWLEYAKKMRNDEYDIIFDGPHFNAWRMKHLHHVPVASLPGSLQFYLVTYKSYRAIKTHRDLVGRKICGMPSPHLATDMILDLFRNPAIQPVIYEVPGGIRSMYKAFKEGHCLATIFRIELYDKLPQEDKDKLRIIAKTRSLPNQTVSVGKRLQENANELSDFLVSDDGVEAAGKLLARYSKNARYFQRPAKEKFKGAEDLLEGVVFGW